MFQRAEFRVDALEAKPLRESDGQERWDKALSGRWQCALQVVTPLCIKAEFERQYRAGIKAALIPGSSLRGMVRNEAEVLGAGCGRFYSGGRELPADLSACNEAGACLVCRVFGFVDGKTTWQSRVRFSDARAQPAEWDRRRVDGRDGPGGEPERKEGWAVFVHREPHLDFGKVACVMPPTKFAFQVEYQNLDATELAVFRLALTLEGAGARLVHKLGFAKSLGLGSCRVSITNEGGVADGARQDAVRREIERYARMSGFRELMRWRTE